MFEVINTTHMPKRAVGLAELGQDALETPYPGIRVTHDWIPTKSEFYRFPIEIPGKQAFAIEFSAFDVANTHHTDEGWKNAFLRLVERDFLESGK